MLISSLLIPFWLPFSSPHWLFRSFFTLFINTAPPTLVNPVLSSPENIEFFRNNSSSLSSSLPQSVSASDVSFYSFFKKGALLFSSGNPTCLNYSFQTVPGSCPIHILSLLDLQCLTVHLPVSSPVNRCRVVLPISPLSSVTYHSVSFMDKLGQGRWHHSMVKVCHTGCHWLPSARSDDLLLVLPLLSLPTAFDSVDHPFLLLLLVSWVLEYYFPISPFPPIK